MDKKKYILDTNVLLHEPLAIYSFDEHDVIIPMVVLEELDRIKDRKKDVSQDARVAIRTIDNALANASPEEIIAGVALKKTAEKKQGTLAILPDYNMQDIKEILPANEEDHRIINCAIYLQEKFKDQNVVLVTKDINMRLKAKGSGMNNVEDYRTDQLISDVKLLTKGYIEFENSFWQKIKTCSTKQIGRDTIHSIKKEEVENCFVNQYLLDKKNDFVGRIKKIEQTSLEVLDLSAAKILHKKAWGVTPKNIYQAMALDALLNPDISLVILTGPAGCGKTLLAMASALEQAVEKRLYDKIIVTRNTPEIAESIGFLPGTEEEKMAPWLGAITDTLEFLHKEDESQKENIEYIMEKANIQFKSINFMRGRSIQNSFVLLDECQNLSASQLKTIITRCGVGTKIVCSGNLAQIDTNYLTAVTSGLTYIVEKFKDFEGSANVYLNGVVRSPLASFAEEKL